MSTNVIINGCCGRMGKEIAKIILSDEDTVLVGGLEFKGHSSEGRDIGEICGVGSAGVTVSCDPEIVDFSNSVIIDFTTPEATESLLKSSAGKNTRFVIGTTGLSKEHLGLIETCAQSLPVVFSPNMGLGINILFNLTQLVAGRLGQEFDIEIIEAHHRFKKDSPSGTARKLGEIASEAIKTSYDKAVVDGRSGLVGERPVGEIGMHAVRGGDIVGDHTVLFAGLGERIELKHTAHSRTTFASGAVLAAKWLAEQNPGLYSMQDVLGF